MMDLPTPSRLHKAALCVRDALDYKRPQLHRLSPFLLDLYDIQRHHLYRVMIHAVVIVHSLCILLEPPYLGRPFPVSRVFPIAIHLVSITVYVVDLGITACMPWRRSPRTLANVGLVAVISIDAVALCTMPTRPFLFARCLRPALLLVHNGAVRRIAQSLVEAVRATLDILVILVLVMLFFALLALRLFGPGTPGSPGRPFATLADSMVTLTALATEEFFPDAMTDPLDRFGPVVVVFFIMWFLTATFAIMSSLAPVIYESYTSATKARIANTIRNEWDALNVAFEYADVEDVGVISSARWLDIVDHLRPGLPESHRQGLVAAIDPERDGIDLAGFLSTAELLRHDVAEAYRDPATGNVLPRRPDPSMVLQVVDNALSCTTCVSMRTRARLQTVVSSPVFQVGTAVNIVVNTCVVVMQATGYEHSVLLIALDLTCLSLFALELAMRIVAAGFLPFWSAPFNRFDSVVVVVSVVVEVIGLTISRSRWLSALSLVEVLRLTRALRPLLVIFRSSRLRTILTVYGKVVGLLIRLSVLMLIFMYAWAIIGLELMRGRYANQEVPFANFSTFPNALLVLFGIVAGDDWHDVLSAATDSMGDGAMWVSVYLIGFVIVVINGVWELLLAVLLDLYLVYRSSNGGPSPQQVVHSHSGQLYILSRHHSFSEEVFAIALAKVRKAGLKKIRALYETRRRTERVPSLVDSSSSSSDDGSVREYVPMDRVLSSIQHYPGSNEASRSEQSIESSSLADRLHSNLMKAVAARGAARKWQRQDRDNDDDDDDDSDDAGTTQRIGSKKYE
ncbi:Ion transport domain-containing protein [Plasmodiophora brassicae]